MAALNRQFVLLTLRQSLVVSEKTATLIQFVVHILVFQATKMEEYHTGDEVGVI